MHRLITIFSLSSCLLLLLPLAGCPVSGGEDDDWQDVVCDMGRAVPYEGSCPDAGACQGAANETRDPDLAYSCCMEEWESLSAGLACGDDDDAADDDDTAGDDDDTTAGDDDDTTAGGCTNHNQCANDEFCSDAGNCEGVVGREFTFYLDNATVQPGPYGGSQGWEAGDGAPDAFLRIETPTTTWDSTPIDDTLTPEWNDQWTGVFNIPMSLTFFEDDLVDDDTIAAYSFSTADELAVLVRLGANFELTETYITWAGGVVPNF